MDRALQSFPIAGIPIGDDHPPLIISDIGTYCNRDLEQAERFICAVKAAGSRIIKAELLYSADICLPDAGTLRYYTDLHTTRSEALRALVERRTFALEDYRRLFALCTTLDMPFVLTVYDLAGAELAAEMGACALKIASANIVHGPLIRKAAGTGLPLILDTGEHAGLSEIARAVHWALSAGCRQLIVAHCPPPLPAGVEDHHLRLLGTFRRTFHVPVGLSDRHPGDAMMCAATALRAAIIEKGVRPEDALPDRHAAHALAVSQLADAIAKCSRIYAALGSNHKLIEPGTPRSEFRMGLISKRAVQAGETLTLDSVDFAFPTVGIPVELWDEVEHWQFNSAMPARSPINWANIRPGSRKHHA